MKITKSQIKKIIQEEIANLLDENRFSDVQPVDNPAGRDIWNERAKRGWEGMRRIRQNYGQRNTGGKLQANPEKNDVQTNQANPESIKTWHTTHIPNQKDIDQAIAGGLLDEQTLVQIEEGVLDVLKTLVFPASTATGNVKNVPPKEKLPIVHGPVPGSRKGGFHGGADPRQPTGPRQSIKAYMEEILGRLGLGRRKPVEQWTETNPETGEKRMHMDPHEKRGRYITDPPGVTRPRRKTKTFKGSR